MVHNPMLTRGASRGVWNKWSALFHRVTAALRRVGRGGGRRVGRRGEGGKGGEDKLVFHNETQIYMYFNHNINNTTVSRNKGEEVKVRGAIHCIHNT